MKNKKYVKKLDNYSSFKIPTFPEIKIKKIEIFSKLISSDGNTVDTCYHAFNNFCVSSYSLLLGD